MKLKPNSIVVHDFPHEESIFKNGEPVLYLGEIRNMKGHGIFVKRNGEIHWGWHIERFRYPKEDEY